MFIAAMSPPSPCCLLALLQEFELPGIGSIGGFSGDRKSSEFFFSFTSKPKLQSSVDVTVIFTALSGCQMCQQGSMYHLSSSSSGTVNKLLLTGCLPGLVLLPASCHAVLCRSMCCAHDMRCCHQATIFACVDNQL
jgi:hypothetical protein